MERGEREMERGEGEKVTERKKLQIVIHVRERNEDRVYYSKKQAQLCVCERERASEREREYVVECGRDMGDWIRKPQWKEEKEELGRAHTRAKEVKEEREKRMREAERQRQI